MRILQFTYWFVLIIACLSIHKTHAQTNLILTPANSPYYILSDTTIQQGDTLLMLPGSELLIGTDVTVDVYGHIRIEGGEPYPAIIAPIQDTSGWNELIFHEESGGLSIHYGTIINGRITTHAIPVHFDNVHFINTQTLHPLDAITRINYGSTVIENSSIQGSNQGEGFIIQHNYNPIIRNSSFDAIPDAVELISCSSGSIIDCVFSNAKDDAIDLNDCQNTEIAQNIIYNFEDRGMEIGSESFGSSIDINIHHCIVYNCKEGINFKENSSGAIVNCDMVQNEIGLAILDDSITQLGSQARVQNSIFFDNNQDISAGILSSSDISYSSSDKPLNGLNNYNFNPQFKDTTLAQFALQATSPCIDKGIVNGQYDPDWTRIDLGAIYYEQTFSTLEDNGIQVWPNPLVDILKLQNTEQLSFMKIRGERGAIVYELDLENFEYHEVDLTQLAAGLYFIEITNGNNESSLFKVIKL